MVPQTLPVSSLVCFPVSGSKCSLPLLPRGVFLLPRGGGALRRVRLLHRIRRRFGSDCLVRLLGQWPVGVFDRLERVAFAMVKHEGDQVQFLSRGYIDGFSSVYPAWKNRKGPIWWGSLGVGVDSHEPSN